MWVRVYYWSSREECMWGEGQLLALMRRMYVGEGLLLALMRRMSVG